MHALAAVWLCVGAAAPRSALAVTVILKSSCIPAYDAAAQGCRSVLRTSFVELSLDESSPSDVARQVFAARATLVVAIGPRAAEFARARLPRTPLVFCLVQDPEKSALTGPGVTGVTYAVGPRSEMLALKQTVPHVRRVALVHTSAVSAAYVRSAVAAAADVGIRIVDCPVPREADVSTYALRCINSVDALWLPPDPALAQPEPFRFLVQLCVETRKPLLAFSESLVRGGALLAIAPDYYAVGVQAADMARRVLNGDAAEDIPIVPARKTRLVFNESTGRAIGIARASRVLEAEIVR